MRSGALYENDKRFIDLMTWLPPEDRLRPPRNELG